MFMHQKSQIKYFAISSHAAVAKNGFSLEQVKFNFKIDN